MFCLDSNGRINKHFHSIAWRKTIAGVGLKKLLQNLSRLEGEFEGKNRGKLERMGYKLSLIILLVILYK